MENAISQLLPSAQAIRAFSELVESLRVDGVGGDQTARTVAMHIVGDVPTGKRVEFPESTIERVYDVSRELFAELQVQRNFQYREVQDLIFRAAISARVDGGGAVRAEDQLRETYREISRDPEPIRMLFQIAPRLFFPEDEVKIGDVTRFRGTDSALAKRWAGLARLHTDFRDPFLQGIKGQLVAEFTVAASPGRAEEIAAERLMATLGVVGIAYAQLFHDWPTAGLLPSHGASHVSEDATGQLRLGPATFYEPGLMQFPIGYLPSYASGTGPLRLGEAIAERRSDDVSRRLIVALQWWSSGNEPGPWAMRFSKYMTVFETLFGRASERGKPGLTARLAARTAAFVASDAAGRVRTEAHFRKLYNLRSDTVHQGALVVEPIYVFDAMMLGANAIGYLARSTFIDDPTYHHHLDVMTRTTKEVWIRYGWANGLDHGH